MHWHSIANGGTIGTRGSECGLILRDDEFDHGARITLERDGTIAPLSITCGIYGWMAHTRLFSSADEADREFDLMKKGIEAIIQLCSSPDLGDDPLRETIGEAIGDFVQRFP